MTMTKEKQSNQKRTQRHPKRKIATAKTNNLRIIPLGGLEEVGRNMIVETKVIEKPVRRRLRSHHQSVLLAKPKENGITAPRHVQVRLNQQNLP